MAGKKLKQATTITLNPVLFNILLTQGHITSNQDGTYTEQDGINYTVRVLSTNELEVK